MNIVQAGHAFVDKGAETEEKLEAIAVAEQDQGGLGARALKLALSTGEPPEVRLAAVRAVGSSKRSGLPSIKPLLVEIIKSGEETDELFQAAVVALRTTRQGRKALLAWNER